MKRIGFIIVVVLPVLFLLVILLPPGRRYAPKYVPGKTQPVGNYTATHYVWGSDRPFVNDKVWIWGQRNGTNRFTCLYDLRERVILGELDNAGAIAVNQDETKLLVVGRDTPAIELKARLLDLLQRNSGGKITVDNDRTESFWVMNLKDNSSKRVGSVKQWSRSGSGWYASPDLRYVCTSPTTELGKGFVLFDFQNDSLSRISMSGYFCGWWDDQHVLLRDERQDYLLYDVAKRQNTLLLSAETIRQTLKQLNLPSDPTNVVSLANWNGREYDFYFVERDYKYWAKCFVLKLDRTLPPALKLVFPEFKFERDGRFNPEATQFLYPGEGGATGRGGNGAVYLRDLSDNAVRTLVPPDNKGQYSIPRFYGNEVIYYRNRVLWRMGLDGSNNVPLFTPTNPLVNR